MEKNKKSEYFFLQMEINTLDNGKMIKNMDKE